MPFNKDTFLDELGKENPGELNPEEVKELAIFLGAPSLRKAFAIVLNGLDGVVDSILNADLSTQQGIIAVTKNQGKLEGVKNMFDQLADMAKGDEDGA